MPVFSLLTLQSLLVQVTSWQLTQGQASSFSSCDNASVTVSTFRPSESTLEQSQQQTIDPIKEGFQNLAPKVCCSLLWQFLWCWVQFKALFLPNYKWTLCKGIRDLISLAVNIIWWWTVPMIYFSNHVFSPKQEPLFKPFKVG